MVDYVIGDIVEADSDLVVNAANGIGWMGGFLTRHWKFQGVAESINYASCGEVEKEVHRHGRIHLPGDVFFTDGCGIGRIGIIHAVTMLIPGWWTTEKTVRALLPAIADLAEELGASSVAMPFLGCGTGRLKKDRVRKIYEEFFAEYEGYLDFLIYDLKE